MNKNAKAWVEALRSGKYPQTKNYLHDTHGFCCLGVACELAIEDGVPLHRGFADDDNNGGIYYYGDRTRALPESVQKWLGLKDSMGSYGSNLNGYNITDLVSQNDSGKIFNEIADIIEQNEGELFTHPDE